MERQSMLDIEEISEVTDLHAQTIRNWEKANLISPIKGSKGKRLFNEKLLEELTQIKNLRDQGYRINDIVTLKDKNEPVNIHSSGNSLVSVEGLKNKSVSELMDIAKDKGIKYFRQMHKHELVLALTNSDLAKNISKAAKKRTERRAQIAQLSKVEKEIEESNQSNLVSEESQLVKEVVDMLEDHNNPKEVLEEVVNRVSVE